MRLLDAKNGFFPDIKVGFDKEVYKSGEPVILTIKRGNEIKEERMQIMMSGGFKITSEQIKIDLAPNGPYYFDIYRGDT